MKKEQAIQKFLNLLPVRFEPAVGETKLQGVHLEIDESNGRCLHIERISIALNLVADPVASKA